MKILHKKLSKDTMVGFMVYIYFCLIYAYIDNTEKTNTSIFIDNKEINGIYARKPVEGFDDLHKANFKDYKIDKCLMKLICK
jgi:hypothetical protein